MNPGRLRILVACKSPSPQKDVLVALISTQHELVFVESEIAAQQLFSESWFDLNLTALEEASLQKCIQAVRQAEHELFAEFLDQNALQQTHEIDPSGELFKELRRLYFEIAPQEIRKLRRAAENKNFEEMSRIAHSLKSTSRNTGCQRMSIICQWIEKLKSYDSRALSIWIDELERLFKESQGVLNNYEAA